MNLLSGRLRILCFFISMFLLLILLLMLLYVPTGVLAEIAEEEYATGLRPLTPEEQAELDSQIFRITAPRSLRPMDALPAQAKNTEHLPVVRSQGQMGTCAAFATAYYYKTYQEARERGWQNPDPATHPERVASPTWAYNLAPRGGYNIGVNHWQVAQQICDYGIANWEEMWYDPQNYDYEEWPTEDIWRRAAQWRGEQVGAIAHNTPEGLEALKEHLAGGDLAVVGVPVYSNFDAYPGGQYTHNGVFYNNYILEDADDDDDGYRGGHALTVVGYDDEMEYYDAVAEEYRQGALLLVNSWGTNWGVTEPEVGSDVFLGTRGFIWIAYDFFLDNIDEWEGHSDALIMTDRHNYQPEKFALIGIDHTNGRQLFVDIKGGEYDEPLWERAGLPHGNPGELYVEEHGFIAVDLTDYKDYEPLSYYLAVRQVTAKGEQLGGEGDITYFAIQQGDDPPFMVSPDVPVSTELGDNEEYRDFAVRAGLFNEAGITFDNLKLRRGGIAWADFNGNGYPDLLASGLNPDGEAMLSGDNFTGIFPNQGDGTFDTALTAGLPQLSMSLVAAADYNNNGYPDVALRGRDDSREWQAGIYRNNGDSTFTQLNMELPDNIESLAWVDINNSGRMDLAVGTTEQFLIYENRGGDSFVPQDPLFDVAWYDGEEYEGKLNLTTAWGDYDGNGLADLAVVGEYICGPYNDRTRIPLSTVLKNQGNGTFKDMEVDLPVLNGASAAWGDYNKNGLLDLAVSGFLDNPKDPMDGITAVYRNNGDGTFTDIEAPLGQAWNGAVAWGDINNNGWLDLVVTGQNDYTYSNSRLFLPDHISVNLWPYPEYLYDHQTKVFLNDRQGSFADAGGGLPRVSISNDYNPGYHQTAYNNTLALVDYELNGGLDIFLSGTQTILFEYLPEWLYTGIYRNEAAAVSPNTSPEAPDVLNAWEEEKPGTATLQWNAGSDAETPAEGLYYNLRVGTSPGEGDIISGANAYITPGRAVLPGREYTLSGLPSGTYYWSVQTLDAGYAPSAWSPEQSFEVTGSLLMGDVNGDGDITVSDAIIVLRHVVGLIDIGEEYGSEAFTRARLSGNADITVADAIIILRTVVGLI